MADASGVGARLEKWTSRGSMGWVFDNAEDEMKLDSRFIGFDMTDFLDNAEIRTPLMLYLFRRIDALLTGERTIIAIDEFWKALGDDAFRSFAQDGLKTYRKRNALMVFATQSPADALKSDISHSILEQVATKIMLPNPNGNRRDYVDGFSMTEAEYALIREELSPESRIRTARPRGGCNRGAEIVANCGVEVAFTPKELRVANELSERIGYIGQESVTKSLTINGILANRSKSMSDQRRALLLPQELMQFPNEDLLLLRGGMAPIHGDKIRYYEDNHFRSRVMPAPVVEPIARRVRDDEDLPDCVMPSFGQLTDPDPEDFAIDCVVTSDFPDMLIDVATEERGDEVVGVIEQER